MFPYSPRQSQAAAVAARRKIRALLSAAATFRQSEQPKTYRHVHPHGHATAKLARAFAAALMRDYWVRARALDEIELGAHLHDIGKYLIPEPILLKPGALSAEERAIISLHPAYGAQLLAGLSGVTDTVYRVVLCHHERWDGEGYPEGLKGARIPFAARLVAVCDVYTSLRARRPYKPALSRRDALTTMQGMAGYELDPDMVHDFPGLITSERRHGAAAGRVVG
jgi:HD-GYP domain-containing protein (c-di-GMP phosphodiesterase class II)